MMAEQQIDPLELVQRIRSGQPMSGVLIKSLLIHLAVILLTSVPYLAKVLHYGTFDVRAAAEAEQAVSQAPPPSAGPALEDAPTDTTGEEPAASVAPERDAEKPTEPAAPSAGEVSRETPTDSDMNVDNEYGL